VFPHSRISFLSCLHAGYLQVGGSNVRNTMMKTARELYEAYENDVVSKRVKGQAELGTKFYHRSAYDLHAT
jgi:hypothetical protein